LYYPFIDTISLNYISHHIETGKLLLLRFFSPSCSRLQKLTLI